MNIDTWEMMDFAILDAILDGVPFSKWRPK
jgi:hypothetical protein